MTTEIDELRQELNCPKHVQLAQEVYRGRTEYKCGCTSEPPIPSLESKLERLRNLEAEASKFAAISELEGLGDVRLSLEDVRGYMQRLGYKKEFEGDVWGDRPFWRLRHSLQDGKKCSPADVLALVAADVAAARRRKEEQEWDDKNWRDYLSHKTVTCRCGHQGEPEKVRRAGSSTRYELVCTECGRIVLNCVEDTSSWFDYRLGSPSSRGR